MKSMFGHKNVAILFLHVKMENSFCVDNMCVNRKVLQLRIDGFR